VLIRLWMPRLATGTVLWVLLAGSPAPAEVPSELRSRLDRGEIIVEKEPLDGSSIPEVIVTAVIDAPPERVWPLIDQCGNYGQTMIHVRSSRELSRAGGIVRCESVVTLLWPLPNLHAITRAEHTVTSDRWQRVWTLESGDYKSNGGSWVLTRWGQGRTLAEYRQRSEPKVAIPAWFQNAVARYALPDLIEKIRAQVK
jgi:hypothetical protein